MPSSDILHTKQVLNRRRPKNDRTWPAPPFSVLWPNGGRTRRTWAVGALVGSDRRKAVPPESTEPVPKEHIVQRTGMDSQRPGCNQLHPDLPSPKREHRPRPRSSRAEPESQTAPVDRRCSQVNTSGGILEGQATTSCNLTSHRTAETVPVFAQDRHLSNLKLIRDIDGGKNRMLKNGRAWAALSVFDSLAEWGTSTSQAAC